jgi:TonB-linked SusC/RagA family outer membrane protein
MGKFKSIMACLLLLAVTEVFAQIKVISGKVTDEQGQPVPFATVRIKGIKVGVAADADGNFSIKASEGQSLLISGANITTKEIPVTNSNSYSISVTRSNTSLNEVVVTALGIRRQAKELGYATTAIGTAQLNQAAVVNPATGLAAKVSGVDIRLADNGINPQVKVTFRGSRSIEGNNTALVIVDGVPVDQTYLANLNPSDIGNITILKGSNAAALYGMAASNGVMNITTKKGRGNFTLTYENVINFESISYFPALQNEYSGWGGEGAGTYANPATGGTINFINPFSGLANTVPFENESFGNAYNSLDFNPDSIPIGITAGGKWLFGPYKAAPNGRKDFFQTGVGDQNKLSGSIGGKRGGLYFSGEHTSKQGVVPTETYVRNGGRINGNLNFGRLAISGGVSYSNVSTNSVGNSYNQNRPIYWDVMNILPNIDLKSIKNVSLFQNNQGFIGAYFPNPWWQVANSRSKNSTDQLVSNLQLNYKISSWLTITAREGYSRSSSDAPSYIDSITFPAFLINGGGPWGFGSLGTYPGNQGYQMEHVKDHYDDMNGDLFFSAVKDINKFKFNLIAGGNYRMRTSYGYWYSNQINSGPVVGENIVPNGFTKVTDSSGGATATYNYKRNDQSVYGDLVIGYDDWLFLHGSFRNDWTSILDPNNRSFSYPSVDVSVVLSDKLSFLKNSSRISFLKVRLGYSGTGNVSLDGYQKLGVMGNIAGGANGGGFTLPLPTFGAYAIYPTTIVGTGFPFGTTTGYSQSFTAVQNGLRPEHTKSLETGFQLGLFNNKVNIEANYYNQVSNNQTIPLQTSAAAGISTYLTNAGEINNSGVEVDLALTPLLKLGKFKFDLAANFSYQDSRVINIAGGKELLDQINFGTIIVGGVYAISGKHYPELLVTDFNRDPQGHIIVDGSTGLPTQNPNPVDVGNTNYKYFLGLSPTFSYKRFSLRAVFDYRGGAVIMNEEGNAMDFAGISSSDAVNRQAFIIPNSVIQNGAKNFVPNTNVPITSAYAGLPVPIYWWANFYDQIGRPYVTSADFWKLRELTLSYEMSKEAFGSQKILKGLTFSLIGRNLFMWRPKTNQWSDPEFSTNATGNAVGYTTEFQTPPTRIISFSIKAAIL